VSTWSDRSVFVTGAYGLLGSWLARGLVARDARVTVLKRDHVPASALVIEGTERLVNVVHGDVRDAGLLDRALGEYEVDTVFHLAAQTIVGVANRGPASTFETNIRGTWALLEACRRAGIPRTVVASSDKAYGPHHELPYREDFPLQPCFPYDVSKAAADLIARSYWHTFGLPVAVTRCANLYGGGDFNFSRLVPEAVVAAIERRAPMVRSDGTPERDFLYVEDAVAAYLAVCDLLDEGRAGGEAFNAGSGEPHSVLEVVELVCALAGTGMAPDVRGAGTPPGEIDRQWLDSSKLRAAAGWEPRIGLEDGLRRTIAWYRRHAPARGVPAPQPGRAPADHLG
jgi:CDP-glucose 4,6-dehydratase